MTEEEIAVAVKEAHVRGKRVSAHARSAEAVKQCVRHGIEIIYHASFADEEALDMLERHRDRHFVAPGLAWLINTSYHAAEWGISPESAKAMGYHRELEVACETLRKMHKRGIRILPGGDYGFAWMKHGDEREGPRVLREVPRLHADGGAALRDEARRPDHDAGRRARAGEGGLPRRSRCSWTAIRSPISRCSRIGAGCSAS